MKVSTNQAGMAHLTALLMILAVVAGIGFAGYRVVKHNDVDSTATLSTVKSTAVPKQIESNNDLLKAENSLDNTPIESSVDPGQLDSDISALN